ncbi:hypothetical protein [Streptomyces sp. NPDC007205]|uniref:hypothetical protein n=1 Tax=Streptomyces sp. NPDC007205 TaxID=3154316 RepID=UPI0033D45C91
MFARRALAIAVATPVLLATIGMTGAAAATSKKSTLAQSVARPEPAHGRTHGEAAAKNAEEEEEDDGILTTLTGELAGRF